MKYYRKSSNPLIELSEEQVKAGEIVYSELGKCVKKVYVEDNVYFVEVVESVLNEGEREIINLKILGDLTFKEIASVLSMPMGTVTWKYQNAVKKIRRCGYEQGF